MRQNDSTDGHLIHERINCALAVLIKCALAVLSLMKNMCFKFRMSCKTPEIRMPITLN